MRVSGTVLGILLIILTVVPSLAATATPAPTLNLVVIGDSIPFGGFCMDCDHAFVPDYALRLEGALGREVTVMNRSRDDGAKLNQIADQVENEESLREQLSSADLVIISAGINDGPTWGPELACGIELGSAPASSTRDMVDQILTYTEDCLDTAVATRAGDFRRLFTAVDDLVPDESPVMVVNAYNWWTGWPDLVANTTAAEREQIDQTIAYFLDAWNEQECALAAERGFVCIDVYHAFNGPDGMSPAGDLLGLDYSHPSRKGNALIADLLMDANVLGGPVASPASVEASPAS